MSEKMNTVFKWIKPNQTYLYILQSLQKAHSKGSRDYMWSENYQTSFYDELEVSLTFNHIYTYQEGI